MVFILFVCPVTIDTNISFEIILVNIGSGWFPATNSFLAPVAGVYLFSASMVKTGSSGTVCHIVHTAEGPQESRVVSMRGYTGTSLDGDANTVIIELEQGDLVSVQLESGDGEIWSSDEEIYSSFSGLLLFLKA